MKKPFCRYLSVCLSACVLMSLPACNKTGGPPADSEPATLSESPTASEPPPVFDLTPAAQDPIVDGWPAKPLNFTAFDWRQRALDYYYYILDESKDSTYKTLFWNRSINRNLNYPVFNLPDYYGDARYYNDSSGFNTFTNTSMVLGASLVGIDMTKVDTGNGEIYNFVEMLREAIDAQLGVMLVNPVSNGAAAPYYGCWWFDLLSNLMYFQIGCIYPDEPGMTERLRVIADKHYEMADILLNSGKYDGFDYDGFNFKTMTPIPQAAGNPFIGSLDAGVGAGIMMLWSYDMFGDEKYLEAAKWCMDWYEQSTVNRFFDNFIMHAPYLAARLNAECGTNYSLTKYMTWAIDGNSANIGMMQDRPAADGYDYYGLMGFLHSYGESGRAYFFESVHWAYLLPAVKYDVSLANAVGKWILHLASNARYFYPDQTEPGNQYHGDEYIDAPEKVIPYEAFELIRDTKSDPPRIHYASGDPSEWRLYSAKNPSDATYAHIVQSISGNCTDLALYDGNWAGMLAGCVDLTDNGSILRMNVGKLDYWTKNDYPVYLYYNPLGSAQTVTYEPVANGAYDLYDALTYTYTAQGVSGNTAVGVPAGNSVVLVELPAGSRLTYSGNAILCGEKAVAYLPPSDRSLSFGKIATASSSDSGRPASNITDGYISTQWSSETGGAQWAAIDLGESRYVNHLSVDWGERFAAEVVLMISGDGAVWTDAGKYAGKMSEYPINGGDPVKTRYIRLELNGSDGYDIRSARVYLSIETEGVNLLKGATATTNSQDSNPSYAHEVVIEHVVDGMAATRWAGAHTKDVWILIDAGREISVNELILNWSAAYATGYSISFSLDGADFDKMYETENGKGGVEVIPLSETRRLRYLRLDMDAVVAINGNYYAFSINEIEARYWFKS